jgi:8-oxo-dGTP pyrophosphatase MutT (NUDIX family)
MMKPRKTIYQAAAIAVWQGRICLVTSRSGKRWVVPKGCLEPGKSPGDIVLQEAWEEAGLTGVVRQASLGTYNYWKAGKLHAVRVYLMDVREAVDEWPEDSRRERRWVRPEKALMHIREEALRQLIRSVFARPSLPLAA